jgi:hypothetical protein
VRDDSREFRVWVRDDDVGIDDEVIRDKPPAGTSACSDAGATEAVGGRLEVRSKVAPAGVVTRTDDILKL